MIVIDEGLIFKKFTPEEKLKVRECLNKADKETVKEFGDILKNLYPNEFRSKYITINKSDDYEEIRDYRSRFQKAREDKYVGGCMLTISSKAITVDNTKLCREFLHFYVNKALGYIKNDIMINKTVGAKYNTSYLYYSDKESNLHILPVIYLET